MKSPATGAWLKPLNLRLFLSFVHSSIKPGVVLTTTRQFQTARRRYVPRHISMKLLFRALMFWLCRPFLTVKDDPGWCKEYRWYGGWHNGDEQIAARRPDDAKAGQ
jgi:hypothetical protein